jgi:fumarylacetoacetase
MSKPDATHDAALRSWVESANAPGCDFPIQNLPFGVFQRPRGVAQRIGIAIGDSILDLAEAATAGLLQTEHASLENACRAATLNELMALGRPAAARLRSRISSLLSDRNGELRDRTEAARRVLMPMSGVDMRAPAIIGDYTDFYASIYHATNVGSMFRPDHPLLPNYKYVPIAYHGRASSIVPGPEVVRRPRGQIRPDPEAPPLYAPSRMLDYEFELGFFIGSGNDLGSPISITEAEKHLFGVCLVNDWSARDIQSWEYQPLGPFLAKSFATTISPWVVTMDALAPFRTAAFNRAEEDPQPLEYLRSDANQAAGGLQITLEAYLQSAKMRDAGLSPYPLSRGNFETMYWTPAQLVAHHASNGCNLRPGDLLASGTVSGPGENERGCLLELTWRGSKPLKLPSGEERRFLADNDEVIFRGWCEREGFVRIGFGECRGMVLPATEP